MLKWLPYPMVRIAIFFIGGVLLGIYAPTIISIKIIIGLLIFCMAGFFALKFYSKENRFPTALGCLGLFAVFLLGLARLHLSGDAGAENHFSKIKPEINAYEAIVRSVPEAKGKSWKIEVELTFARTNHWQPVTGKVLLYVSKQNFRASNYRYGDRIAVRGHPQELQPPANPGEFDFKRFYSFKHISGQQFAQAEDIRVIAPAVGKGAIYYSHQVRAWAMKILTDYVHGEDERAIAIALVLGVTDGIDNDLQNAYAASGAMHVLAVSGMHVGIIYAILLLLFKPINKYPWSKWVMAIVSLIFLWVFAFVTGLSPSVLRAVVMFSFIALARPFGKQTNIYNTLAASVVFLLIYNPHLIMSVGFQLSYLAVLGIVYGQRRIYNLWEIENRLGDWIWQLSCVSMAAQAATFALGLLYFHQFPSYFLISNLLVVPLSTAVLVVGIFLLAINFIPPLALLTALILEWLVKTLNWIVFKTEALPFSLINDIYISAFQCCLLIGILITLIFLFQFKSIKWLYISFGLTLWLVVFQWRHFLDEVNSRQMIVYQVANHYAIEFIDRGHSYFIGDSSLRYEQVRLHIQPNRLAHGVSVTRSAIPMGNEAKGIRYFKWGDMTFGWMKDRNGVFPTHGMVDCLIVSDNALSARSLTAIKSKSIIFDGSNSVRHVNSLTAASRRRNMATYSTREKGAYIF